VKESDSLEGLVIDEHLGCTIGGQLYCELLGTVRYQEAVCCECVTKVLVSCRSFSGKDEWVWQVFDRIAELCRSHVIRLRVQQEEGEGSMTAV